MALRPCDACSHRVSEKLSSVYWSWNLADRSRRAYLQRLCLACFIQRILPLLTAEVSDAILCPGCHSPSDDDMDPVFAKVYCPGQPVQALELPYCPKCAVTVRVDAQEGAVLLPDRNPEFGGQAPERSLTSAWDSLGLRP